MEEEKEIGLGTSCSEVYDSETVVGMSSVSDLYRLLGTASHTINTPHIPKHNTQHTTHTHTHTHTHTIANIHMPLT